MIFDENHTLLEGVSLIATKDKYEFVHMNGQSDPEKSRPIDSVRIPNAEARIERFCEMIKASLAKATINPMIAMRELPKVEAKAIAGFSGAVDKNFPEAVTKTELNSIASKYGLQEFVSKITSDPKPEQESPNRRRSTSLRM